MPAAILINPVEVDNRLATLGWTREELIEVVGAMVAARNSCTDNDPSSAPGWMAWKEGTRRLREIGRPKGLQKDEESHLPSLIDLRRRLRFAVSNTDDGTGVEFRIPQNRSKKGPATDRLVDSNQASLFDGIEFSEKVVALKPGAIEPGGVVAWYLCVYSEGDEVRAELSCPLSVEAGFFSDFYERIVLVGPDDGWGGVKVRRDQPDDHGSEFDIPVSRK